MILLHGQGHNIFVIHFKSASSKRRKRYSRSKSKYSVPKTQITIGIVHNTITTCCRKKGFINGTISSSVLCSWYMNMNMNEFLFFFVVDFWSFFSTEMNTLSEKEPEHLTPTKTHEYSTSIFFLLNWDSVVILVKGK